MRGVGAPSRDRVRTLAPGLWPAIGFLAAAFLIVARRPDAVTHAEFWAEDGTIYYANVYNHGVLASLTVPQAGYLEAFSVLAAGASRLVALAQAPLVTNLLAIGAQALPVGLLLSRRAGAFAPDVRARMLLAALYVAIPDIGEIDANAVNAQWHLAVAALIVLVLSAPARRSERLLDGAILLICGLTGPFCILLTPLAWLLRRWRASREPAWSVVLLSGCAAVQILCLAGIYHRAPAGFLISERVDPALGATPGLLARLIGGKTIAAPVLGDATALSQSATTLGLLTVLGVGAVIWIARAAGAELRAFLLYAAGLLTVSLLRPQAAPPAWLALSAPGGGRYFLIGQLAVLTCLVWASCCARGATIRGGARALLLTAAIVAIPTGWSYAPFAQTRFASEAGAFDRAPRGTLWKFPLNPAPASGAWQLMLRKR